MSNKERLENNTESSGGNTKNLLYKNIANLMKKAQELSTLCDAQPGIVIFSPDEYILCFTQQKRNDNLDTHETNLVKKMKAQEENIRKMELENEEKKMKLLFNEVVEGKSFLELDARELKGIIKQISLNKTKVVERKKQLQQEDKPIKGNGNNIEEMNDEHPKK
ncbi:hypothetical protein R3W88_001583 [Solanum pinnatisectum]|uniref:MADS-box domain-containing protein n=1 Tax=Solanum pinnatisectum TaxID=50273 RepID=A0AAV9MIY9_9SOLN|nr:hypothetical protein R3W88_001583 [Solanum pinnatisectum]